MADLLKVLIVDDEPDIIEFLSYNFSRGGYEVKTASNGLLALQVLKSFCPDIIVSDVLMPEINGIEFCRIIKRDERLRNIPLIFISAANSDELAHNSIEAGADRYLSKTVKVSLLMDVMQTTIRKAS